MTSEEIKHLIDLRRERDRMTNEETIEVLDDMKIKIDIPKSAITQRNRNEALDKAIKALEQQPCENCISRQALLDKLEKPMNWTDSEAELQEQRDYEGFVELVKSMPSVIPKGVTITDFADRCRECGKTKTGHWIKTGDYYTGAYECLDYFECSCCHEESLEEGDYCPNCGADMRESEEQ